MIYDFEIQHFKAVGKKHCQTLILLKMFQRSKHICWNTDSWSSEVVMVRFVDWLDRTWVLWAVRLCQACSYEVDSFQVYFYEEAIVCAWYLWVFAFFYGKTFILNNKILKLLLVYFQVRNKLILSIGTYKLLFITLIFIYQMCHEFNLFCIISAYVFFFNKKEFKCGYLAFMIYSTFSGERSNAYPPKKLYSWCRWRGI